MNLLQGQTLNNLGKGKGEIHPMMEALSSFNLFGIQNETLAHLLIYTWCVILGLTSMAPNPIGPIGDCDMVRTNMQNWKLAF